MILNIEMISMTFSKKNHKLHKCQNENKIEISKHPHEIKELNEMKKEDTIHQKHQRHIHKSLQQFTDSD